MTGTVVANAFVFLVVLVFRNGCAASAQDTELLSIVIVLLVTLPERGFAGFPRGVVV